MVLTCDCQICTQVPSGNGEICWALQIQPLPVRRLRLLSGPGSGRTTPGMHAMGLMLLRPQHRSRPSSSIGRSADVALAQIPRWHSSSPMLFARAGKDYGKDSSRKAKHPVPSVWRLCPLLILLGNTVPIAGSQRWQSLGLSCIQVLLHAWPPGLYTVSTSICAWALPLLSQKPAAVHGQWKLATDTEAKL